MQTASSLSASDGRKLLVCGLGGGLDVLNASVLFHVAQVEGRHVVELGSVRPYAVSGIRDAKPFADCGALLSASSSCRNADRFAEPRVSELLGRDVFYFARNYNGQFDSRRLREALEQARRQFGFTDFVFVDGGGDSLLLQAADANAGSEHADPFRGGDAELLQSAQGLERVYMGVVAVGLDIDADAFQKNLSLLKQCDGYFGCVNLATGERSADFRLESLFAFGSGRAPSYLEPYFSLAERVLVLREADLEPKSCKLPSHTGTVAYHALRGHFGVQRTFVPWEPKRPDGSRGVSVEPSHCWMYFFDLTRVETLKRQLNRLPPQQ